MKRMLIALMAVAVLVAFTAPSFAGEGGDKAKEKGKDKQPAPTKMIFADEKKPDPMKPSEEKKKKP